MTIRINEAASKSNRCTNTISDMENMQDEREDFVGVINMHTSSAKDFQQYWTVQNVDEDSKETSDDNEENLFDNLLNDRKLSIESVTKTQWRQPSAEELRSLTAILGLKDLKYVASEQGRCTLIGFD